MDIDLKEQLNPLAPKTKWHKKALYITGLVLLLAVILSTGAVVGAAGYMKAYDGKVYPGVMVDSLDLGGLTRNEARSAVENFNNKIYREGIKLLLPESGKEITLDFQEDINPDSAVEIVHLDTEKTLEKIMTAGRYDNWVANILAPLSFRLHPLHLGAVPVVDKGQLEKMLRDKMSQYGSEPQNASIKITSLNPLAFETVEQHAGVVVNYDKVINDITALLGSLSFQPVVVRQEAVAPTINTSDLPNAADIVPVILNYGNVGLNYVDPQSKDRTDWNIPANVYSHWMEIQKDGDNFVFGLNAAAVKQYLEGLRATVDQPAENAKFTMEGDKVKEFKTGKTGVILNVDKTYEELNKAFVQRNYRPAEAVKTVGLTTDISEPEVKLTDINNLGVTGIIGTGDSTFFDSYSNRIKNIAHAVERLNGTIIKPGEEFSTIKSAGPFTAENGYLPEEVIKGDKIQKEIGGGMCQIGTTLFRMAMNSGMPITERRNHSLVVHYYADPVNHNPGTDATVYEPILDFKFLNDTGNYLLLQTEIDYKKQMLVFTLWGTPDGRKGSYTHPIVKKWIPAGEPKMIETDTLKPGQKKCQAAFRGAETTFVYTRVTPTGEEIKRVFDSYYRPLPQICMVGKSAPDTTDTSSSTPAELPPVE